MAHERIILDPDPCNMIVLTPQRKLLTLDRPSGIVASGITNPIVTLNNPAIPTNPGRLTVVSRFGTSITNTDPCRTLVVQTLYRCSVGLQFIIGNHIRTFMNIYSGLAPLPPLLIQEVPNSLRNTAISPTGQLIETRTDATNLAYFSLTPGQTLYVDMDIQVTALIAIILNGQNVVDAQGAIAFAGWYL